MVARNSFDEKEDETAIVIDANEPFIAVKALINRKIRNIEKKRAKAESLVKNKKDGKPLSEGQLALIAKESEMAHAISVMKEFLPSIDQMSTSWKQQKSSSSIQERVSRDVAVIKRILKIQRAMQNFAMNKLSKDSSVLTFSKKALTPEEINLLKTVEKLLFSSEETVSTVDESFAKLSQESLESVPGMKSFSYKQAMALINKLAIAKTLPHGVSTDRKPTPAPVKTAKPAAAQEKTAKPIQKVVREQPKKPEAKPAKHSNQPKKEEKVVKQPVTQKPQAKVEKKPQENGKAKAKLEHPAKVQTKVAPKVSPVIVTPSSIVPPKPQKKEGAKPAIGKKEIPHQVIHKHEIKQKPNKAAKPQTKGGAPAVNQSQRKAAERLQDLHPSGEWGSSTADPQKKREKQVNGHVAPSQRSEKGKVKPGSNESSRQNSKPKNSGQVQK